MKKTIAKIMAAAMLVASVPAMTMPTLTVEAKETFSTSYVKFNGTYQSGNLLSSKAENYENYLKHEYKNTASDSALILKTTQGMVLTGTGIWNTHLQYLNDDALDDTAYFKTSPTSKVGARTLSPGTSSISQDYDNANDYFDQTGVVKSIALNSDSEMIITLDETKLTDAKKKDLAAGNNNKIEFTPWRLYDSTTASGYKPVFTIQIGETYTTGKTQISGVSTADGFITDATVTINNDYTATLIKVSNDDKKVNMKGKKIEVSEVEVGGVTYAIRKFEEQCLKSAKMKRITAKQVKNIETGALRGCKRLTRVTMGNTKIKKIHSNAFYDCEKLKNIKINCKNLKAVGSKAFKGLKKNCVISIKAKKSKYNQVVKMIKKSGTDQVKFKRI